MEQPIINPIEDIVFTLNISSTANYPVDISILGNPYNPLDTSNAETEYQWNFTGVNIAANQTIILQYHAVGIVGFTNYYGSYQGNTIQDIVNSLNSLGIGFFATYTTGGNTYISTYNDDYVFGNLTINGTNLVNINFNFGSGFDVYGIYVTQDNSNRVITSGKYALYNGNTSNYLTRMSSSGVIDLTFNTGGVGPDNSVFDVFVDSSNNYFLSGQFSSYNLNPGTAIYVKLDSTGNIDATYNIGIGYSNTLPLQTQTISSIVDSLGNVYVGGEFNAYNGTLPVGNINKTDNLGNIDATFNANSGIGFNGGVNVVKFTNDGNLIVGGNFTDYNGNTASRIIKLFNYGLPFPLSFGVGFNNIVIDIFCYSSGKYLIAGLFTSYNLTAGINRIVRLNSTATIDATFDTGTGFNGIVERVSVNETTGKIVVVGSFTSYNGTSCNGIIRLNSDGSVDTTWNVGTAFSGTLGAATSGFGVKLLSNGTYVVVGSFTSFDGTPANGIIGLLS